MPERLYHLVAINEKTGAKVYLSDYPITHAVACVWKSKFNPHKNVRIQLEQV